MIRKIDKSVLLIRTLGNILIAISLFGLVFTFWPVASAYIHRLSDKFAGKKYAAAPQVSTTQSFGSLLGQPDPNLKILIPKDPNFSIIVEKIGANAPIIANIDASKRSVYNSALKRGVAHALGTAFPGQNGVTYLFAHSTDTIFNVPRYNAVFYLLGELNSGDKIVLFFNGKRYDYLVAETKITEASDISYFTLKTEEQLLILQTCYPPGTTWKRFLVIAKPTSSN